MKKNRKWMAIIGAGLAVVLATVLTVTLVAPNQGVTSIIGQGQKSFTIGHIAYAAGTADYYCDGTADDVQIQAALNTLPSGGGKLVVLAGSYSFSATVTRAINNVTIEGVGRSTSFAYDASNPIFTAGGNNWVFRDFITDAGGVNIGATTGWVKENLVEGSTYLAFQVTGICIDASAPTVTVGGDLTINDTLNLDAGTTTDDYFLIRAFDTGNAMVEVAKVVGAADPYFSMGGSQEFKFYNSGVATFGALTLGGTVTLNSQVFDAGSGSLRVNTTGAGEGLDLYSTNAGTNGVRLSTYHVTTSPAVDDVLFEHYIYGNATGGAQREAATLRFLVEAVGATTLAGKMDILLRTGSAWNEVLTLSSAGDLWLDGGITTGGSTPLGRTQHWFSGNFVSDGSSDFAWKQTCGGSLTGADGDTAELIGSLFANTIATQTIVDESIGLIAQVEIDEPAIIDNLSGTGEITVAATLYVKGAPDEGVSNAAVWVNAGDMKFAGETDSAAVADQVALGGYDVGVNERALAISQECAVAVEVDETKFSHKMPIRINGATYFMMLTQS